MIEKSEREQIIALIKREVVPAIGCTEPIAVALCVARATELLESRPEQIRVALSANILKNAMGVGIPGTGGMIGLPIAIALGTLIGKSAYQLEVLKDSTPEAVEEGKRLIGENIIHIALKEGIEEKLYIEVTCQADGHTATAIISGGHTIHGAEPIYGLAVTGFVHPQKIWRNSGAEPGDVLILTKPLGVGILTTAAKAELVEKKLLSKLYQQMSTLNKYAHDVLIKYSVHACTDVTGFALLGHSLEMAQGSNVTIHLETSKLPYHQEAYEMASMGFIPAGAYRNREFAQAHVKVVGDIPLPLQDICYDPQTSGGLLCALPEAEAATCLAELQKVAPCASIVGYVTEKLDAEIYLEP